MALLLAKTSGDFLVPHVYYNIFVVNLICPAISCEKHQNSDKMTGEHERKEKSLVARPRTKGHVLREQHCPSDKNVYLVVPKLSCTS